MKVENILLEEQKPTVTSPKEHEGFKCIFYKTETCTPKRIKFSICSRCHRSRAITAENLIPQMFSRIIGLAVFLMGTMGLSFSGSSSGGGGASGSGSSSGGGGK